jgi:hypothetical protein
METLDAEYRTNETRYRAALVSEDNERKDAKGELETRDQKQLGELIDKFELRQVALALDEGRALEGATAEVVQELRAKGGYRGVPVPWLALERRTGETIASGTPDPVQTRPIIDRLFPDSVAARMGAQLISIDSGSIEYPVATDGAVVGWQTSETGAVGTASAYATTGRVLRPDNTLGVQMKITRKALKQSGDALEQAVRRDMNSAMAKEMDRVVFLGSGSSGEPTGIIPLSEESPADIESTAVNAPAQWSVFRAAVVEFMTRNAVTSPAGVRLLVRPEVFDAADDLPAFDTGNMSEWDRLLKNITNVVLTRNALEAPTGSPAASVAVLTTSAGGVPPIFIGAWGAVDLVRDPFSDAASGGLRLTALATLDLTYSRGEQLQVLTGVQG